MSYTIDELKQGAEDLDAAIKSAIVKFETDFPGAKVADIDKIVTETSHGNFHRFQIKITIDGL